MSRGGAERKGGRESEAGSAQCHTEPGEELDLTNRKIMTRAEIKSPLRKQRSHSGTPTWGPFKCIRRLSFLQGPT